VVICLEQGADLYMAQLVPLLLTVSCFSKIHTGFTFLVPAHPGSPGKRAVKRVCVLAEGHGCEQLAQRCYPTVCEPRVNIATESNAAATKLPNLSKRQFKINELTKQQ